MKSDGCFVVLPQRRVGDEYQTYDLDKAGTCTYRFMHIEAMSLKRELAKPAKSARPVMVPKHCSICLGGLSPSDAVVYVCGHGVHRHCAENKNFDHTKCYCCDSPLITVS